MSLQTLNQDPELEKFIQVFNKQTLSRKFTSFVEDNPLFNLYNSIEPIQSLTKHQYEWFKETIDSKVSLICSSRQSGKTLFVITYAHFMSFIENKSVAIITRNKSRFTTPILSNRIDLIDSLNPSTINGRNYDIILFDEFAYFSQQREWLNQARNKSEKIIAISSSNPGSVFNELCYKHYQRNPFGIWLPSVASNFIQSIKNKFNKKESIKVVVTKVPPVLPDAALEMLGQRNYDIEYNCSLL